MIMITFAKERAITWMLTVACSMIRITIALLLLYTRGEGGGGRGEFYSSGGFRDWGTW